MQRYPNIHITLTFFCCFLEGSSAGFKEVLGILYVTYRHILHLFKVYLCRKH